MSNLSGCDESDGGESRRVLMLEAGCTGSVDWEGWPNVLSMVLVGAISGYVSGHATQTDMRLRSAAKLSRRGPEGLKRSLSIVKKSGRYSKIELWVVR